MAHDDRYPFTFCSQYSERADLVGANSRVQIHARSKFRTGNQTGVSPTIEIPAKRERYEREVVSEILVSYHQGWANYTGNVIIITLFHIIIFSNQTKDDEKKFNNFNKMFNVREVITISYLYTTIIQLIQKFFYYNLKNGYILYLPIKYS